MRAKRGRYFDKHIFFFNLLQVGASSCCFSFGLNSFRLNGCSLFREKEGISGKHPLRMPCFSIFLLLSFFLVFKRSYKERIPRKGT